MFEYVWMVRVVYVRIDENDVLYVWICILHVIFHIWVGLEVYVCVIKLQVSFAKEPCTRDDILQKRPITCGIRRNESWLICVNGSFYKCGWVKIMPYICEWVFILFAFISWFLTHMCELVMCYMCGWVKIMSSMCEWIITHMPFATYEWVVSHMCEWVMCYMCEWVGRLCLTCVNGS